MKKLKRKSAKFEAVLVYMDEPLLITLISGKSRLIASAIPSDHEGSYMFFGTTVSKKDWEKYLDGSVDLRYLFTYPDQRSSYTFDLASVRDGTVMMTPFLDITPETFLPSPQFFSSNHTEEYGKQEVLTDTRSLYVDGEWELSEFGQFNQRYADVYAFHLNLKRWLSEETPLETRIKIKAPFIDRPYKGGFSYVHLFKDLNDNLPKSEQISLSKIRYASPGFVEVNCQEDMFTEVSAIVKSFLSNRREIYKDYSDFYLFLHRNKYLAMSGDSYVRGEPSEKFINSSASALFYKMTSADFGIILELANYNALVAAKIVLGYYRRLNELGSYFAQGRASFEKIKGL